MSMTVSVQIPESCSSISIDRGAIGWKEPVNGGLAAVMLRLASSSKTVSSKRMTESGATISPPSTQKVAKRVMPVTRAFWRSE